MALQKTLNFLPSIFQTETNKKFLGATLDQLVTEPNLVPISGYVGRKFSPGYQGITSYIREPNASRADYQLEPSIVIKNQQDNEVEFHSTYPDLLQKVNFFGGNATNQNNLFRTEYYTYNPQINLDAFVNYGQYYWLPNGPESVEITNVTLSTNKAFYIYPDNSSSDYFISGFQTVANPDLVLVRGGTYTFEVNQRGKNFWLQTEPGKNVTSDKREVLGVSNNGDDVGTVTFVVPLSTAQDFYISMPVIDTVNFVSELSYAQVDGQLLSSIRELGGLDGISANTLVDGKKLIFKYNSSWSNSDWDSGSGPVSSSIRYNVWDITLTPSGSDYTVNLSAGTVIPTDNKVIILSGLTYAGKQFYKPSTGLYANYNDLVPEITAPLDTLYYQDGSVSGQVGRILLIDSATSYILDIDNEILGKENFISQNGIIFTNGLKVKFVGAVTPSTYQNKEYYIEGVGDAIRLVDVDQISVNNPISKPNFVPTDNFTGATVLSSTNVDRSILTIESNAFPVNSNIKYDNNFPNSVNLFYISEQDINIDLPLRGGLNQVGDNEDNLLRPGIIGMSVSGIPLYGPSNQWYVPGVNSTTWNYDTSQVLINGQDTYGGFPDSNEVYHYHDSKFISANAWGNLSGFTDGYVQSDGHSKLIGFAIDGYPIYGPFGYTNPTDSGSGITRMSSSYFADTTDEYRPVARTVTVTANTTVGANLTVDSTFGLNPGMRLTFSSNASIPVGTYYIVNCGDRTAQGPADYKGGANQIQLNANLEIYRFTDLTFEFLPGAFIEDYRFQEGLGTLDRFNGRYCVTPEYPAGTYAYFATQNTADQPVYPYFIGPNFYGKLTPDTNSAVENKDYITINRSSRDLNAWSIRNRWFHQDIIQLSALYNNKGVDVDITNRASRPILEFKPDLQLYNFGKTKLDPIDIYDTTILTPFTSVQGLTGLFLDQINVLDGMRIIFSAAEDENVRNKIYLVNFVDTDGIPSTNKVINLTLASDATPQLNNTIYVKNGVTFGNKSFWYNGTEWIQGQVKTGTNQAPKFDIVDSNDVSYGDTDYYPPANADETFLGCKILSYLENTGGTPDSQLGFPVTYRSINNQGDIVFSNNYDSDIFTYKSDATNISKHVNTGYIVRNNAGGSTTKLNVWATAVEESKQYQDIGYEFNGIDNDFRVDILPSSTESVPNLQVFLNYNKLSNEQFQIITLPNQKLSIRIEPTILKIGDRVDILVFSDSVSNIGFYQVPKNLNNNPQNDTTNQLTLGEVRNHVIELSRNSTTFVGSNPGRSNLRDVDVSRQGGTILQQSGSIALSEIFLCDERFNLVNSIYNAQQEYTRFKNKFLTYAGQTNQIDTTDPVSATDYIIKAINQVKNKNFAWYYSDMLGYGDNKNTINYTIFDALKTTYEITDLFTLDTLSNKSVLVYLNNNQLVYGRDYVFSSTISAVVLQSSLTRNVGNTLRIVEYNQTDGCWIPETPTKLGLYPKFYPEIVSDDTYLTTTSFIVGHDGSRTPVFGDYRDNLLLELEKRIFNNIKVDYAENQLSIYDSKPGKFRNTGYTVREFNDVLSQGFLQWAGFNRLDYSSNTSFNPENAFTFNYSKSLDSSGSSLPGSWRSCYEYFYDTQRPHTHPWEMLGFSIEPDWWQDRYGPAPYTSANSILWTDLENGYIADGSRQGYDTNFARPGLSAIIPVTVNGVLKSPIEVLTKNYYNTDFEDNWAVGEWGPVETAWRNSSEWPFVQQIVMAITKPAKYFGLGAQVENYRYNSTLNQYLLSTTNTRLKPEDLLVNGRINANNTIQRTASYTNWVQGYLTTNGTLTTDSLYNAITNFTVQLSYRMAGYTDKTLLKVLADQYSPASINESIIVPDEDFEIVLSKSSPLANLEYSAVVITKTNGRFQISGYNTQNPTFKIYKPNLAGESYVLTAINKSANYYTSFLNIIEVIDYNTQYDTLQEVVDFIAGYEKYLTTQGFQFEFFEESLGQIKNWTLSAKEFLFWNSQEWPDNSSIVLSPVSNRIKILSNQSIVDSIQNSFFGTKVLDQNYNLIGSNNYTVLRNQNEFELTLDNQESQLIGLLSVNLVQYEHILIFNNVTQFNDIIYSPTLGQRQFKLKLVGSKTTGWDGSITAEGFIYNRPNVPDWKQNQDYLKGDLVEFKTFYYAASRNIPGSVDFDYTAWLPVDKDSIKIGLLNNFATNAGLGKDFYDVNKVNIESEADLLGFGLIGFRNRSYLNNAGINDTSQLKFYQGFIKQKGTRNAINAISNLTIDNEESSVLVNEQWAFRVGAYGALETNQYVELVLDEDYTINNPTSLLVNTNNSVTFSSVYNSLDALYKSETIPFVSPFLLNRDNNADTSEDTLTAGFVNIEDVDYTIFDLREITTLNTNLDTIGTGNIIWTAKDYTQDWDVYYVNSLNVNVTRIRNALDGRITLRTDREHGLSVNDTVIVQTGQQQQGQFSSFYRVLLVDSAFEFTVEYPGDLFNFAELVLVAPLFELQSLRIDRASQILDFIPDQGWTPNSKAWVNYNTVSNNWAVYNKSEPWSSNVRLNQSRYYENGFFGSSVKVSTNGNFILVGQPGQDGNVGAVTNYLKISGTNFGESRTISPLRIPLAGQFGSALDSANNVIAIGAYESGASSEGYVTIYSRDFTGDVQIKQVISSTDANTRQLGYSVSMSRDNQWLYVGAPGSDEVLVYAYDSSIDVDVSNVTIANALTSSITLDFTPATAELLLVSNSSVDFVAYRDYTISGDDVIFTSNIQPDDYVIRTGPGFRQVNTLTGNAGSNFGFSVAASTEGAQVVIGAPDDNTNYGSISVYNRSIEKFISSDGQYLYGGVRPLTTWSKVYVGNEQQVYGVDWSILATSWVDLVETQSAGTIVTVETNEFALIETTQPTLPIEDTKFGYSVDLCPYNCSIYVGAPNYSSNESLGKFQTGAVYRFTNQGRIYGNITGTVLNPTVSSGDSIFINNYEIAFLSSSLDYVVSRINESNIPGVTAFNTDGYLRLTSDSTLVTDKLRILPGQGSAVLDLGLDVFVQTEIILNPTDYQGDQFGLLVQIDNTANRLIVGSTEATTEVETTFDLSTGAQTTFDNDSTIFVDDVESGAVWVLNYLNDSRNTIDFPGKFAYVQQLNPDPLTLGNFKLQAGIKFGSAFDVSGQFLYVGASHSDLVATNAGSVVGFYNEENLDGWDALRVQEPKVDIVSIVKSFIYDSRTQTIIDYMDYIDPAKGKVLGIAEQEITYKIDYDPAVYSNATTETVSNDGVYYWSAQQLGQVWWDLSTVRYIDYEQGSVKYRNSNWGRVFPNSSIDVYEWIESEYPPSQYVTNVGDGEPKYPDDSAYTTLNYIDPQTGVTVVRYFYWVKNKTNVDFSIETRTLPTIAIANYISNPKNSGIKYFAAIRNDAVSVFNVNNLVTGKNTIFHLSYLNSLNNLDNRLIHSEYSLLSEGSINPGLVPTSVYNKIVDSISGLDSFGNQVPDPALPVQQKYGILIRPRQSVFVDKSAAVRTWVDFCNSVFSKNLISFGYNLQLLQGSVLADNGAGEQIPAAESGAWNIQVPNYAALTYIAIAIQPANYKVLVLTDETVGGLWTIYTKQTDNTWLLTRVQSYRTSDYWGFKDWYADGFSSATQPLYTVQTFADVAALSNLKPRDIVKVLENGQGKWQLIQIFPNIVNTIGVEDGTIELLNSLWDLERYGLSFDTDLFDNGRFDQNPNLEIRQLMLAIKNNIFVNNLSKEFINMFFSFINRILNEQKNVDWVFKTSFIDVIQQLTGLTRPQIYSRDNQDLYNDYIEEIKPYHTTIKEYVVDYLGSDNYNGYTTDFDVIPYKDPVLGIYRSPSGEFVQDSVELNKLQYRDWTLNYPYGIRSIEVVDGGSGYTSAPNVTITGSTISNDAVARAVVTNGVVTRINVLYPGTNYITQPNITISGGNGSGAKGYAQLQNNVVRKNKTVLVYDRLTYSTTVLEWQPNTAYTQGDILTYSNIAYQAVRSFTSGSNFSGNDLSVYKVTNFDNANDRITAFYASEDNTPTELRLLQTGIDYPGVTVEGPLYTDAGGFDIGNFDISPYDALEIDEDGTYIISDTVLDTKISSDYTDSILGTRPEDIRIDGGPYISEQVLDWTANTYYPQGTVLKNNGAYYMTNVGLTTGSSFGLTDLIIYPLDPYSAYGSHAPEELVPGRVYDTLDVTVYTFATDPCDASYQLWVNVTAFSVANIQVVDGGLGYDSNVANITVTISGTGGATANVTSVDANGTITAISIISAGSNYITVPNVTITGSNTSPATAFPRLTQSDYTTFDWRIFKDMNDNFTYYRLDAAATVTLTNALTITSNTITVSDSSKLANPAPYGANPGVIMINGERITYYQKDDSTNTLSQLRRGTGGTGTNIHANGSTVVDMSIRQEVPNSKETTTVTGLTGSAFTTAGVGYLWRSNLVYIRGNLIYDRGLGSVEITTEEEVVLNLPPNIILTEGNVEITTEPSVPTPADPCGQYVGQNAQTVFIKQGAA